MERQKIKRHIEIYISELERSIHEPIVERDVGRMPIDAAKAFFLLLPMLNGERWTRQLQTAAIAVGAVHAAFDAHDSIDIAEATSKEQQLTVLSGDHFSGVHYRLLASIPALGFVQSLSMTIGRINEVKTTLHGKMLEGHEQLIEAVSLIEAGCIVDFLHTFGFSQYVPLANAALPLLLLDDSGSVSNGRYDCQSKADDKERAMMLLHAELQRSLEGADFLEPFLRQEIRNIAMPLLGKPI